MKLLERMTSLRPWLSTIAIVLFLVGSVSTMGFYFWYESQTEQTQWYLAGRVAYDIGDDDTAILDFDRSIAAYQDEQVAYQRSLASVRPSLEQAQLALFHKANALVKLGNSELAVQTFKDALNLITDEALSKAPLSEWELGTILKQRVDTETDLELLFRQRQDLALRQGKGKGQQGQEGKEKQSEDPSQNGNQAGKDPRDAL
jgi:tetratricopeptide (TPR) repeat protein